MLEKIHRSPALWLGMVVLNACSYIKNTYSLLIILSAIGIFSSAYLYEKYKTSRIIVILEKENE